MDTTMPYASTRFSRTADISGAAERASHDGSLTVLGTVRAAMAEVPYILIDGPDERQFMVNRKVAGPLWGELKVDEKVVLEIVPGELSRVLTVARHTA